MVLSKKKKKKKLPDNIQDTQVIHHILNIHIENQAQDDFLVWDKSANGNFSNKFTWKTIRHQKTKEHFMQNVWNTSIPLKISSLLWRPLLRKQPLDDVLHKFGRNVGSKYAFCDLIQNKKRVITCLLKMKLLRTCGEVLVILQELDIYFWKH